MFSLKKKNPSGGIVQKHLTGLFITVMTLNCWHLFTETFWLAFVPLCVHIYIKNWHTSLNGKTANTWSVLYFSTQNPIFWLHRRKCLIFRIMNNRKERGKIFFFFFWEWNVFRQSGFLSSFFTHVAYWLNVFWHNCYTFGMGNTQVGVFSKGQTHRLHLLPALWNCRFVLTSWVIPHTRYWKES